jgi:hypothetical protein
MALPKYFEDNIKTNFEDVKNRIGMVEQEELSEALTFDSLQSLEHQIDLMLESLTTAKKWVLSAYDELDE